MFLSRIELDVTRQDTMRALASPNYFHGAIESAASDGRERKLWRVDSLKGKSYLMILSGEEKNWTAIAEQFGVQDGAIEVRCYDVLLNRIKKDSKWHFRLRANPTITKKGISGEKVRGKVLAHITEEYQKKWLMDRAVRNGFSLEEDEFLVTEQKWYSFYKGKEQKSYRIRLLAVTYEGVLTVTDVSLFKDALTKGIGREKAYGMGMLTIVSGR